MSHFDEAYEKRLLGIWQLLQKTTDADLQKRIVDKLTEQEVTDLRKFKNPLKKPVLDGGNPRYLLFSLINLEEKYMRRLTMTSLIGFLYRMLDEYTPKSCEELPSEEDPSFSRPLSERVRAFKEQRPLRVLEEEIAAADARLAELEVALAAPVPPAVDGAVVESGDSESLPPAVDLPALRLEAARLLKARLLARAKLLNLRKSRAKARLTRLKDSSKERLLELDVQKSALELTRQAHSLAVTRQQKRAQIETLDDAERAKFAHTDQLAVLGKRDQGLFRAAKGHVEALDPEHRPRIEAKLRQLLPPADWKLSPEVFAGEVRAAAGQIAHQEAIVARLSRETEAMRDELASLELALASIRGDLSALVAEYNKRSNYQGSAKQHPLRTALPEERLQEPSEAEYLAMVQEVKATLGIPQTREEAAEAYRDQVGAFLDHYLRYNPDNHVVCAYAPNYDPEKGPLPAAEAERLRLAKEGEYERILVPPADTFARWHRYEENHYEALRQATDDIYSERSDLEFAIVPYHSFEAKSDEEARKIGKEWERKHAGEFEASVLSARFFRWNILAPFEQNREVRDFYSKDTEVIKRILDAHQEDEKMGMRLMKDRAERMKRENTAKEGPDAPGLSSARKALGQAGTLEKHGAKHIADLREPGSIPRDLGESKKDELEVHGTIVQPRRVGRRRLRGATEQVKFHVPAEALPEDAVKMTTVADRRKEEEE